MKQKILKDIIASVLKEEFKSQAQKNYFYSQASKSGKEGEKWKKLASEFDKSTPKNKKLPKKITEAETKMDYKSVSN